MYFWHSKVTRCGYNSSSQLIINSYSISAWFFLGIVSFETNYSWELLHSTPIFPGIASFRTSSGDARVFFHKTKSKNIPYIVQCLQINKTKVGQSSSRLALSTCHVRGAGKRAELSLGAGMFKDKDVKTG